jgi:hypothetical protein
MTDVNNPYRAATAEELEIASAPSWQNSIKELSDGLENISLTPGPKGDTGPQGPQGIQGIQGPSGNSFTLKGSYPTLTAFNAGSGSYPGSIGDAWLLDSDGSLMVYGTYGWFDSGDIMGPQGIQGPQGEPGLDGLDGDPLDFLNVASNIVPTQSNYYTLGTPTKRWADVYIGPNTINITDKTLLTNATLIVDNGILKVNGANQLQVGQLKFVNNTIESTTGSTNIEIGLLSSTADIIMNRDLVLGTGKTLTFADSTVQTTAPGVPVSYNPTWSGTGLTFTGTPATGSYMKVGKLVTFRFKVVCTTVTNFGSGQYSITLPFNVVTNYQFQDGSIHRNSNGSHYPLKAQIDSGNVMTLWDGAGATDSVFDHNSPYSLTISDYFYLTGTYEVA